MKISILYLCQGIIDVNVSFFQLITMCGSFILVIINAYV